MPRVQWPLHRGRPCIEISLTLALTGQSITRRLLADSGAGARHSAFALILDEDDCLHCDGNPDKPCRLGGAYSGTFPTYAVQVRLPLLNFDQVVRVVGVPSAPAGFHGIACFPFLRQFGFGNFGNADEFGLEC